MHKFSLYILFFFLIPFAHAQKITVYNSETKEPVFNVAIYNAGKTRSILTNFDGEAKISGFSPNETLIFSHVGFIKKMSSVEEMKANNYEIFLDPNPNQLNEIILSVSKFEQERKNIPQKVIGITKKEIQLYNPQTSADLLENSGQVYIQKSQLGGGSPMIRGFATNRLLITVDGVRMNNAIFRGGNLQNIISIDPLALERTEVVLGPGPVVYGSDAVGGVMNFYTLNPGFSLSEKTIFSGNAITRYATANKEKTAHIDFSLGNKKWAYASSATFSDFDHLRMGKYGPEEYLRHHYVTQENGADIILPNENPRIQNPTGYNQVNVLQKIRHMPNDIWDYSLGLYYSTTSNFSRYDRLTQTRNNQFRSAEWYYGPQQWMLANFGINKQGSGLFYDKAKLNLAYQFFKESRHNRDFEDIILYQNEEHVDAYSANFDFEKIYDHGGLFYGLEYVINKVGSSGKNINITTSETFDAAPRYPDGSTWQSAALYASKQWELNSTLSLQTGSRYSHVFIEADFNREFFNFPFEKVDSNTGSLTGNFGLTWKQNNFLNWKMNLSSAFRAPNIDDIGKIFDSEPGAVVVPNPDLKAEHAYNAELGMQLNVENTVILDLAGYYTLLKDALVRRPFHLNGETVINYQGEESSVQAIQNAANAYAYGLEAGINIFLFENLSLTSQLAITKGREEQDDSSTAPLRHAGPVFGNTHLIFKNKKIQLDLYADYNSSMEYEELAPSEQSKAYLYAVDKNGNPYYPSWYTLNFAGTYKISQRWFTTASLENITDKRYRTYSSGIAAPGRNFILSVRYSF